MKEKEVKVLKSELPNSFRISFRLMLFFLFAFIASVLIPDSIGGTNEKMIFLLQLLPFVFITIAIIFAIIVALILVVANCHKSQKHLR